MVTRDTKGLFFSDPLNYPAQSGSKQVCWVFVQFACRAYLSAAWAFVFIYDVQLYKRVQDTCVTLVTEHAVLSSSFDRADLEPTKLEH
jgi:hypothetical protein